MEGYVWCGDFDACWRHSVAPRLIDDLTRVHASGARLRLGDWVMVWVDFVERVLESILISRVSLSLRSYTDYWQSNNKSKNLLIFNSLPRLRIVSTPARLSCQAMDPFSGLASGIACHQLVSGVDGDAFTTLAV